MRIGKSLRTIFGEPLEEPVSKSDGDSAFDQLPAEPESEATPEEVRTT